jgi:hypothetical protein
MRGVGSVSVSLAATSADQHRFHARHFGVSISSRYWLCTGWIQAVRLHPNGAGLRTNPSNVMLFDKLVDVVHRHVPQANPVLRHDTERYICGSKALAMSQSSFVNDIRGNSLRVRALAQYSHRMTSDASFRRTAFGSR